jgi:hypothetical protein
MSILKHIAGTVFAVSCMVFSAHACDVCGSFIGVTPYDNQSGFMLQHRYVLYSRLDVQGQPLLPAQAYRVAPQYSVLHTGHDTTIAAAGDFESFKIIDVRGRWFLHRRVELNALLPFVMNRARSAGELSKLSGVGDAAVWVGIHVIRRTEEDFRQRLIVGFGVKFPTGKNNAATVDGTRAHLYLQPGTGSFDQTAYIQYSVSVSGWGAALNANVKRNGANAYNEMIAPSATGNLNFFRMFKRNETVVMPQLQFYGETTAGYTVNAVHQPNSAMGLVMGGAGCDAFFGQLGVHFSALVPLAQITSEQIPGATLRVVAGVSWNINQQKFLIN